MRQRLTHDQTLQLQDTLAIDDLLLLPESGRNSLYEGVRSMRAQTVAINETLAAASIPLIEFSQRYRRYRCVHGEEPAWATEYPIQALIRARADYAATEAPALAILNYFKHSGFSYMVLEGGLCEDLERTFNLRRLQGIKQLGFLQAPWLTEVLYENPIAAHNRLVHSYDVMAIATLIGNSVGIAGGASNILRMAAFTHDMGTPAGGDSVKLIDLKAFDEDEHYRELLNRRDWEHIRTAYEIDEEVLVQTILNKGLLGQILDVADKIAYTARDLEQCRSFLEYGRTHMDRYTLDELFRLIDRHPHVCGLWDSLEIHKGELVFLDAARLQAFLKIRALMFREVYYHPCARFGEYLIARVLVKDLYRRNALTRDQLLDMTDYDLSVVLDREYGTERHRTRSNLVEEATKAGVEYRTFPSRAEAEVFFAELQAGGNPFGLLEDNISTIKTGVDRFKVLTANGAQLFCDAYPSEAREIEEMARPFTSVHVYYLNGESLISRDRLEELRKACL